MWLGTGYGYGTKCKGRYLGALRMPRYEYHRRTLDVAFDDVDLQSLPNTNKLVCAK